MKNIKNTKLKYDTFANKARKKLLIWNLKHRAVNILIKLIYR